MLFFFAKMFFAKMTIARVCERKNSRSPDQSSVPAAVSDSSA
jgi:hypothetical protein